MIDESGQGAAPSVTVTPSHSRKLVDLGAHHLVLFGLERPELVHGIDAQHLARPVDLGIQHPDEPIAHQDRVREEAVPSLGLRLELLEHVVEAEDLAQAAAVEQQTVVRIEERHPATAVILECGDRCRIDADLP